MAQALAIVGEAGIHGLEYNGLLELMKKSRTRQSSRARISPIPAIEFTSREFEDYMILAWRFGYVDRSGYKEYQFGSGKDKSSYQIEDEVIRLTQAGWEYISAFDVPIIERWTVKIFENVPVIVASIAGTLLTSWIVRLLGWSGD